MIIKKNKTTLDVLVLKVLKGIVSQDFCFRFFHELSSPKSLKITLGSFQMFLKIREDICKSRCNTCINDTSGKFATATAGVVDASGKFATGVKIPVANNGNNIKLLTP
jgi:hypothetical protein